LREGLAAAYAWFRDEAAKPRSIIAT
jgi:hypothetical protein